MTSSRRTLLLSPQSSTTNEEGEQKGSSSAAMPIMASILVVVIFCTSLYCLWCWRWRKRNDVRKLQMKNNRPPYSSDLSLMRLSDIEAATDYFSEANKLGEGGFGPVYKGVVDDGLEIAVKRLSTKSKQGSVEFKNEVELIAKLQHRNLVKMLGYCIERGEKLLIYEYLHNKSLDAFLFDPNKQSQLDWSRRHQIIVGVARGLLYLHEDSLLKVIHRDLKASNVLLDNNMNPKISDFGMAKIFDDESGVNTGRLVGTFGYMAPEYAIEGVFSVKSDVFSFGVLLIEILSGQRNGTSYLQQHGKTLLSHAWQLWIEGMSMELMDPSLGGSYPLTEAQRCLHIGLLCIQENADKRPTMSLVAAMLRSEQMPLPSPSDPPNYTRVSGLLMPSSSSGTNSTRTHTTNEVTITCIQPR